MAAAGVLADLEELVTCEICYDQFEGRDPRTLPCSHAFCLSCIKEMHDSSVKNDFDMVENVLCPKCQRCYPIPGGNLENLPAYFQASQVQDIMLKHRIESLKYDGPADDMYRLCMVCKKVESCACCFSCVRTICETCSTNHDQNKRFAEHTVVKMTKEELSYLICPFHGDLFEVYCTDCCRPVCKSCLLADHNDHDVTDFSSDGNDASQLELEFLEKKSQSKKNLDEADSLEVSVGESVLEVDVLIEQCQAELHQAIDDQVKALRADLQAFKDEKHKELNLARAKNQAIGSAIEKLEKKLTHFKQPVKGLSQVGLSNIDILTEALKLKLPAVDNGVDIHTECSFVPVTKEVWLGSILYGDAKKKMAKGHGLPPDVRQRERTSYRSLTCSPQKEIVIDLPSDTETDGQITTSTTETDGQISTVLPEHFIPEPSKLLWSTNTINPVKSVDFLPNGNVIAVVDSKIKCYRGGVATVVPFSQTGYDCHDYCIAVYKTTDTIIRGYSTDIRVMNYDRSSMIPRWDCETRKTDFTNQLLACMYNGDVITTNSVGSQGSGTTGCSVALVTKSGQVWKMPSKLANNIFSMASDSKDRLVTCDGKSIIIHQIRTSSDSWSGRNQFNLEKTLTFEQDISSMPKSLCIASNDNILVADGAKKAILLFTPEGKFIREVIRLVADPTVIALHHDKYLAVGTWDMWYNNMGILSVYEVDLTV